VPDKRNPFNTRVINYLDYVIGIALKRIVFFLLVLRDIGFTRANVIEEHDTIVPLKGRCDKPPHILITPEPVGKDECVSSGSGHPNVIAADDRHILRNQAPE
jgi:hypothetical protein